LDADRIVECLVARQHGWVDSEEAAEVDVACDLDPQAFEHDTAHRALRHVADNHAGIERSQQIFLRIGEPVRSSKLARLIDIDCKPTRHPFFANREAIDFRAASRLALPRRRDTPFGHAICRVAPDALGQCKQVVDIDAVHDSGFNSLGLSRHDRTSVVAVGSEFRADYWSVASAAWMRRPWSLVIKLESTLPK